MKGLGFLRFFKPYPFLEDIGREARAAAGMAAALSRFVRESPGEALSEELLSRIREGLAECGAMAEGVFAALIRGSLFPINREDIYILSRLVYGIAEDLEEAAIGMFDYKPAANEELARLLLLAEKMTFELLSVLACLPASHLRFTECRELLAGMRREARGLERQMAAAGHRMKIREIFSRANMFPLRSGNFGYFVTDLRLVAEAQIWELETERGRLDQRQEIAAILVRAADGAWAVAEKVGEVFVKSSTGKFA